MSENDMILSFGIESGTTTFSIIFLVLNPILRHQRRPTSSGKSIEIFSSGSGIRLASLSQNLAHFCGQNSYKRNRLIHWRGDAPMEFGLPFVP